MNLATRGMGLTDYESTYALYGFAIADLLEALQIIIRPMAFDTVVSEVVRLVDTKVEAI